MGVNSSKRVLIVGASKGLGRTLVEHFDQLGFQTFSIGQGSLTGISTANNTHLDLDICNTRQLQEGFASIPGSLHGIICSQRYRGDDTLTGEIATSVVASSQVIELWRARQQKDFCSIILVGSVLADYVSLEMPLSYHICKAALNQMAKYYAVALAPHAMVNCIQLGTFVKPETESFFSQDLDFFKTLSPQERLMHAHDVRDIFSFLIERQPRYLTGQSLIVDGGITSQWIEAYGKANCK